MTSVTDTPPGDADLVTSAIPTAVAEEIAHLRAANAALPQTVATLAARIADGAPAGAAPWEQREAAVGRRAEKTTPDGEFAGISG